MYRETHFFNDFHDTCPYSHWWPLFDLLGLTWPFHMTSDDLSTTQFRRYYHWNSNHVGLNYTKWINHLEIGNKNRSHLEMLFDNINLYLILGQKNPRLVELDPNWLQSFGHIRTFDAGNFQLYQLKIIIKKLIFEYDKGGSRPISPKVFLTKLQGPILPRRSRDRINPKHASES